MTGLTGHKKLDDFINLAAQAKDLTGRTPGLHMAITGEDAAQRDALVNAYATSLRAHGLVDGDTVYVDAATPPSKGSAPAASKDLAPKSVVVLRNAGALEGDAGRASIETFLVFADTADCTLVFSARQEEIDALRKEHPALASRLRDSVDISGMTPAAPAVSPAPVCALDKDMALMKPISGIKPRVPRP